MSDRRIILDPTGLYDIPSGYIPITTEVEWIRFFGVSNTPCWVKGERLCKWAETWLIAWNRREEAEIKQHPRHQLAKLFAPVALPDEWSDEQLLIFANKLDAYPQDNPIAHFLAENVTNINGQIWFTQPSFSHLATWLAILVPQEYKPFEQVWQQQFKEHELATYYQTEDKLLLLRRWIGIAEPVFNDIGKYPLSIPDSLTQEFDRYWEQLISRTEGKILDTLPTNQVGMERIANCATNIFRNHPHWMNRVREAKVTPYLSYQQQQELSLNKRPPEPQPLTLDATPQQALDWVTKQYLPFRRWEAIKQPASTTKKSESLATSFVEWILQYYPQMQVESVENSYLNYSVASKVQNLCRESPILWVVVDGLGWLDHLELLSLLTNKYKLAVEAAIEPRFSILPTKTEYAKWSLYAQLLPNDAAWVADAGKAFVKMGMGNRYTDGQVDKLYNALRKKTHQLYCWDTDEFDSLYHNQKDWESFYELDRPHTLEGIAKKIDYCIQQYPNPELLRIVIASDHGQIMGTCEKITHCPPGLEVKGRMAIGKTDDSRFVVLESDRYSLPHDISIVKSSASLSSFSYTSNKKIIGSHGGLFPEEVVIGVSILRKSIQRHPVVVSCFGEGKPKQSGELTITINNPNSVPLTNLCLSIQELPAFQQGKLLEQEIPAYECCKLKTIIPEVPELLPNQGNELFISGELTFQFANTEIVSAAIDPTSKIIIKQIFTSGFDIDEFL